jgi:putative transposase
MIYKHPEPLRNFDYVGMYYYALTWCCADRKHHFTQQDRVHLTLSQFLRASDETEFAIVAYCFMPDHVHKIIKGRNGSSDGRRYMRLAKQYSGYYFSKAFKQPLWQRYGHDRFLRKDEDIRTVVRYIIENPVRGRLVEKPDTYPFTGSEIYTVGELIEWAYAH